MDFVRCGVGALLGFVLAPILCLLTLGIITEILKVMQPSYAEVGLALLSIPIGTFLGAIVGFFSISPLRTFVASIVVLGMAEVILLYWDFNTVSFRTDVSNVDIIFVSSGFFSVTLAALIASFIVMIMKKADKSV